MNSGSDDPVVRFSTLVEALRWRALQHPEQRIYSYLIDGEREGQHLTFAALDRQARVIAALLQRSHASGQRALLLYPTGLEFIAAFFGCLYAGVIAVPVPSPNPAQPHRGLSRLSAIADDAEPTIGLTTSSILAKVEVPFSEVSALRTMRWIATDCTSSSLADDWQEPLTNDNSLALLQYTSGSTTTPRGVMVSHRNLIHNSTSISRAFEVTPDTVSVTWLPAFHDMGLTNGIIQPLLNGRQCYLMSPQSFLQRPLRWLQAISRYRASISGGPNFAYELCARRITPEQCGTLDLSSWTAAYNGAEPIRAETLSLFSATFATCGFQPRFLYPCYGLAEATLLVSGGRLGDEPTMYASDSAELERNRVLPASQSSRNARILVGCGSAIPGSRIVIVDPESKKLCPPDVIGEIWVAGPSVAEGYWNRDEETAYTFHAYLSDSDDGPFLRTGDLGFVQDGELFVTGRLKDLIIIDGRNVYPHDIEKTAERSHSAIRPGCCAAFSIDLPEERLIVAAELDRRYHSLFRQSSKKPLLHARTPFCEIDDVVRVIRRAVAEEHDVRAHSVVLLKAGSLPRTPSGKLQRHVCRSSYLDGTLAGLSNALDTSEIRQQRLAAHV
jgi:acyl-CoA synthetase (AMP-forming)/AMP-acid ligase II